MLKTFRAETRVDAWQDAATFLLEQPKCRYLNLILSIESPTESGEREIKVTALLKELYAEEDEYPMHTVAETIFPGDLYKKFGLTGMYERYNEQYSHLKIGWGTYAHRLINRKLADGTPFNPLDNMINKMKGEKGNPGPKKACYEIGMGEEAYGLHLYSDSEDCKRRRGAACLSHLSFKLYEGKVHLTALYRSHDYLWKVPGNLLGLARLQACVAHEVRVEVGSMVIHSTYAFLTSGNGKRKLTEFLEKVEK